MMHLMFVASSGLSLSSGKTPLLGSKKKPLGLFQIILSAEENKDKSPFKH